MRRESQQIVPGVLLGPFQVSKDKQKLTDLGITHMYVNARRAIWLAS